MIEIIKVIIDNRNYKISKDTTLLELSSEFQKNFKYPIILAKVNGHIKELTTKVTADSKIEFLDLTSKEGNRTHISGLTYVLIYAIKKLYGKNANAMVLHSLDKGIYIETNFDLTANKIKAIKDKMNSIIKSAMPITKVTVERFEAIKYFKDIKDYVKVGVMTYNTNSYVTLYRLGNYYNYFYNYMPPSTDKLASFDLTYIDDKGFMLRFPTIYINDKIKPYKHHPGMFEVFNDYRKWSKIMGLESSVDLNKIVSEGKINDLIRIDETLQNNKLLAIARNINDHKDKIKVILIAGPSSSGKTTTSIKLCTFLQSFGLNPKVLGMDDYFVDRENNPKDKDGNYDYECLEAIDIKLFNDQVEQLLSNKEILIPTYNFITGKKEFKNKMKLQNNDILIIEGIHAIDTHILDNIERSKKFKIYISALTELNIDDHNRISTTDHRLLRRIIRDNRTRGYDVETTIKNWASVRNGEEKYIFPYQDEADVTLNSALIYEMGVLKTYVEPLLYSVQDTSPYYEEAKRLIRFLQMFFPIPSDAIPQDSVLREFIGNGCFHD